MKPILIDVSKFGGEGVLKDLQKLVDDAYEQGLRDGARKDGIYDSRFMSYESPPIKFNEDGTVEMGSFGWLDDETQSV